MANDFIHDKVEVQPPDSDEIVAEEGEDVDDIDSSEEDLSAAEDAVIGDDSDVSFDEDEESDDDEDDDEDDAEDNDDLEDIEEEEDEDDVVKAIRQRQEKQEEDHPPDINFVFQLTDICFHPVKNIIASATVNKKVTLHSYTNEGNQEIKCLKPHQDITRDIEFDLSGDVMFTASKDKSICLVDVNTFETKSKYVAAHNDGINRLHVIDENTFSTGDEGGTVRVWDVRQERSVMVFNDMSEFVSDMISNNRCLVCSGGSGNLYAFNLRNKRLMTTSEDYEEDLNCLALIKNDTKLIVGTGLGKLHIFKWGEFGLHNDTFPGRKENINSMVAISDNVVITALEDKTLRAVHLFPHKNVGIVGQHDGAVEKVDISNDGHLVASYAEDCIVKFWNIKYFEEDLQVEKSRHKGFKKHLPSNAKQNAGDFFAELAN